MSAQTVFSLTSFENEKKRLFGPDLARSIAIIMVLVSHISDFCSTWFKTPFPVGLIVLGEFGVTLFFTLSGFLIGTIVINLVEQNASAKQWGIFWVRRWGRTLPAYFFWIGILAFLSYWLNLISPWSSLKHYLLYYLTLTQNLAWPMVTFWFAVSWSLTVEEWFYMSFPALLLALSFIKTSQGQRFAIAFGVFLILPVVFRIMVPPTANWDQAVKNVVINRLDAITYGACVAWFWHFYSHKLKKAAPFLCAVGVFGTLYLISILYYPALKFWPEHFHKIFIFNFISLNYALCLPFLITIQTVNPLLQRLTLLISNHSYSLYIVHYSVLYIAHTQIERQSLTPMEGLTLSVTITILLSWFIWRYIEFPLLKYRPKQTIVARLQTTPSDT